MNPTQKIIKNSFWLIAQPLILNIISIFVVGYIARTLGEVDYGKFIFAFAFVSMFAPIGNMGLRAITVRAIAEDRDNSDILLGKVLVLRFALTLIASILIFLVINLMGYPNSTKIVVYIAAVTMTLYTISTTFQDAFQAFEKMQYVAYTNFISGAVITALSLIVLFVGYRLVCLTLVYMLGNLLGVIFGGFFLIKKFVIPKLKVDFSFWKQSIYGGAPFFYPALVATIGAKIGIVLLSKMAGDASVGIYAAANSLVEKLLIIPDGFCTAFFPTIAATYKKSRNDVSHLFQKFFLYLFLLGLPIAVGTTILAKPIIILIYGVKYQSSVLILQILIWWLFLTFLISIQGWTLGAIHREKKGALVPFIVTPCYIIFSIIFVKHYKEIGLAISNLIAGVLSFVIFFIFIRRYLVKKLLENKVFTKVLIANIIMSFFVFLFKEYNICLSILTGMIIYLFAILYFRVVSPFKLLNFCKVIINKENFREFI